MSFTRLLGLALGVVLVLRLLPLIMPLLNPIFGDRWRQVALKLTVIVDVAGGFILLLIVLSVWLRGEPLGALILAVIGIPVFIGTYRALPQWWRGFHD